jgi:3-hydroxyisobutyrate dehydrogenase-like beta-hydroxyacid dehydrogenase
MGNERIGVLHPGSMGVSLAASAKATGYDVCWASAGRSAATRARADEQGLIDLVSLDAVVAECAGLVSICPPHGAEDLAGAVAQRGFRGIYLDANAISPGRARAVADRVTAGGARYVDGGVIGGPAWEANRTVLHLSGEAAGEAAVWFADGLLATNVLGTEPTAASALKMCYAAYTKGTSALFYAILATAEGLGVRDALVQQWATGSGGLAERAQGGAGGTTSRAWRWIDEMQQIAQTFEQAGLPGGFHASASEIFRRMADLRDAEEPTTDDVLRALLDGSAA